MTWPAGRFALTITGIFLLVIIVGAAAVFASLWGYQKLQSWRDDTSAIKSDLQRIQSEIHGISQEQEDIRWWLQQLVRLSDEPVQQPSLAGESIVFVGHVYWFNGYDLSGAAQARSFNRPEQPMKVFINHVTQLDPLRVVFGGDTVRALDQDTLGFMLETLALPFEGRARFVHGNHDPAKNLHRSTPLFKQVFPHEYYFEDVDGVRLIYLNSAMQPGLDAEGWKLIRPAVKELDLLSLT